MGAVVWWDFDAVESFMRDGFVAMGVPQADAAVCADVLITADKRGIDSHGVSRFKPIYIDRIRAGILDPVTQYEVVREGPTTAVVDGHNGMGHVVARRAMRTAIDKAREYGLGMTVVRNSTHYGAACYYPLMAIEAGMIGLTGTNARPSIAPTWGVENMLGTNPMTWGMPTDEAFPFMIDCATSVTQRGKIEVYARTGKPIPEGWVIGRDGRYRTDTEQVLVDLVKGEAALTPLGGLGEETGGHKGYGYAMVVEMLSAALQQGAFLKALGGYDAAGNRIPYPLGHFFLALNVESFCDLEAFKKTTGDICRDLRSSRKAPGAERIWTPGEKEHEAWLERRDRGVPFGESLQAEFRELREQLGLSRHELPF